MDTNYPGLEICVEIFIIEIFIKGISIELSHLIRPNIHEGQVASDRSV